MCEDVLFMDELPSLSELRQKVAGCFEVIGMCPEGECVALDINGNVLCLKVEVNNGAHTCEDDGSPCRLQAVPSDILGVNNLLQNFLIENFISKEGILAKKKSAKGSGQDPISPADKGKVIGGRDYKDEDLGISHHLSGNGKKRRRDTETTNLGKK